MPEPPSDDDVAAEAGDAPTDRVAFDYIKGQLFRVIRADGVIGSVTPNGNIHMAFYSERPAIPRRLIHRLTPGGGLGELLPTETVSRGSIVRELEADLFVTVEVAEILRKWLEQRIKEASILMDQAKNQKGEQT